jgi:hypothetical protein
LNGLRVETASSGIFEYAVLHAVERITGVQHGLVDHREFFSGMKLRESFSVACATHKLCAPRWVMKFAGAPAMMPS